MAVDGAGGEMRSMRVVGGGAFDDQEGGVVVGVVADMREEVVVDVPQQCVGAGIGKGGDPLEERVEDARR